MMSESAGTVRITFTTEIELDADLWEEVYSELVPSAKDTSEIPPTIAWYYHPNGDQLPDYAKSFTVTDFKIEDTRKAELLELYKTLQRIDHDH
jgi:hypothetical protein